MSQENMDEDIEIPPSQMKKPQKHINIEYLKTVLTAGQVNLSNSSNITIYQEQALVVRDIEKYLKADDNFVENSQLFLKGIKQYLKKGKYLKKALLRTTLKKKDTEDTYIEIQQESFIRILLKISCVQTEIIQIILNEITSISIEENPDTSDIRLLLSQLRFLPEILNPEILTDKLIDIIDVSPIYNQLEILEAIPDILPDSEYKESAKKLMDLLKLDGDDQLSTAIIDCLNNLNLEKSLKESINEEITKKLSVATPTLFPVLLQFLLTDMNKENIPLIRTALDNIMSSSLLNKNQSEKLVIFNKFESLLISIKSLSENLINIINHIKSSNDHKPIDYLILFILYTTNKIKKRSIDMIFRKRIKDGLFKIIHLEKLFDNYLNSQIITTYFTSIVEITCNLLRTSTNIIIIDFASNLFILLFNHNETEVIHRQEIVYNLLLLISNCEQKNVNFILKIFKEIEKTDKLKQHIIIIMRLLEIIENFDLKDIKDVYEILCSLTCKNESDSGYKDEIHMIIRKQLSSAKTIIKYRGIIGAVVMAKYLAITDEDQIELTLNSGDNIFSLIDIPTGNAKDAAILLELTNSCTNNNSELTGIYFDQLASILLIKEKHFDKYFTFWLYESITAIFQNLYIIEEKTSIKSNDNEDTYYVQYVLNNDNETDIPIAVNIAGLTFKEKTNKNLILTLSPHFRLLRLSHAYQHNNDLSTIDALLGCGVLLPKIQDDFCDMEIIKLKHLADCYYHCINWFRETISAFVNQRKLRRKILQRLDNLIELENSLNEILVIIPEHKLPFNYIDPFQQHQQNKISSKTDNIKVKSSKKKTKLMKNDKNNDESIVPSISRPTLIIKKCTIDPINLHFRVLDTDIIKLLKYPLDIAGDSNCTQNLTISMKQLKFILNDFVSKLNVLTKGTNVGLSPLNIIEPVDIITDCIIILPYINEHLKIIIKTINHVLEETDSRYDLPQMLTKEFQIVKTCLLSILESFYLLFSWTGFQNTKKSSLLKKILKSLRKDDEENLHSTEFLIMDLMKKFYSLVKQCLHLDHAVNLIKIMDALHSINPTIENNKIIMKTSEELLSKRWYNEKGDLSSGKNHLTNIDILIRSYLKEIDIETMMGLVGTLQKQSPHLQSKDDCLEMLPGIDTNSLILFFRNLLNLLHIQIKNEVQSLTNSQHLILWKNVTLMMQAFMTIAKASTKRVLLVCFLKKSIGILKIFLSHGIPILEIMLRNKPDEVLEILRTLQLSTRFLHHLSCDSKLKKDQSLMAYVPQFRLTLETLVYRVKAILVANDCSSAFWMGNLKNVNLQGEDIYTQSTTITESMNNDNEDELPEDDESVLNSDEDCEQDETDKISENKSSSDVFD